MLPVSIRSIGWATEFINLAANGEAQFSPGPLSEAHKALEGMASCTDCHDLGKGVSETKCLDCHVVLSDRLDRNVGFHATVTDTSCVTCHSEHNGRPFVAIRWPNEEMDAFDHERTDYSLVGAHDTTSCRACHTPENIQDPAVKASESINIERTFLGLSTTCGDCHQDVHDNLLGGDCAACHSPETWRPADGFDHATRFVLDGGHASLSCVQCHASGEDTAQVDVVFPEISAECASCHETPHSPAFSKDCESCHATDAWRAGVSDTFDHDKTRFALTGDYTDVACAECHADDLEVRLLPPTVCAGCHEDAHFGQFHQNGGLQACSDCHTTDTFFAPQFDRDDHEETRFPLEGAHVAIPCVVCHSRDERGSHKQFTWEEETLYCATCHDSPHARVYGEDASVDACETCHQVASWTAVTFNHDVTRFPLLGQHELASCAACHESWLAALDSVSVPTCDVCHEDIHGGQFAVRGKTTCDRCHLSESWEQLTFDHNRDAVFPLERRPFALGLPGLPRRGGEGRSEVDSLQADRSSLCDVSLRVAW